MTCAANAGRRTRIVRLVAVWVQPPERGGVWGCNKTSRAIWLVHIARKNVPPLQNRGGSRGDAFIVALLFEMEHSLSLSECSTIKEFQRGSLKKTSLCSEMCIFADESERTKQIVL